MTEAELWRFLPWGYLMTVALETPVLLAGLSTRHGWRARLFAGFWLTACTYPVVVLVLPNLIPLPEWRVLYIAVAEVFAPAAECVLLPLALYGDRHWPRASRVRDYAAVIAANLVSFLLGGWIVSQDIVQNWLQAF